jgi:hypothetical protein
MSFGSEGASKMVGEQGALLPSHAGRSGNGVE